MRVPVLILQDKVSEKWLERCHEKIEAQLDHSLDYLSLYRDESDMGNIVTATFMLDSYADLTPRIAGLVQLILERYEVVGIWREQIIHNTSEVVIGLKLYGYNLDLKFAMNMLSYTLNGFDLYYSRHVKELRKKRMNRRARGTKLPFEVDARKRTNQNIEVKIKKLCHILYTKRLEHKPEKIKEITEYVMAHEKLDHRNFRGMKNITVRAVKSRMFKIQLNRLV